MPAYVWCDRANYIVRQTPADVQLLIDDCKGTHDFIWLDRLFWDANARQYNESGQVMLRIGAISAVEPAT